MKLPYTEVKSQTGLSSLRVSCKRALFVALDLFFNISRKDNDRLSVTVVTFSISEAVAN